MTRHELHPILSRAAAIGVAIAAILATGLRAEYQASFSKGIQELDHENFIKAAARMRDAIAEHPREGGDDVKISGTIRVPYLPHFWLGVALFNLQDCRGAMVAWAESERQGVILKTDYHRTLLSHRDKCVGPLLAPALAAAEKWVAEAEGQQKQLDALISNPESRPALAVSDFAVRVSTAAGNVERARQRLEDGRAQRDPAALESARDEAIAAGAVYAALRYEARKLIASFQPTVQTPSEPEPRARPKDGPDVETLAPPRDQPTPQSNAPGTTQQPQTVRGAPGLPPALLAGAKAFVKGDYPETLAALDRQRFNEPKAAAQALLFCAASRLALYWLGGEREDSLRTAASADLRAGLVLDSSLRAEPAVFSPRFARFLADLDDRDQKR